MRRPLLFLLLAAAVGCGIDAVATKSFDAVSEGGSEGGANLPPPPGEAGPTDAAVDAPVDAAPEAGPVRPDAGVPFAPSHIQPVYSLTAPAVVVDAASTVDTSKRTIALNGAAAAVSPDIVFSDGAAIWSVDTLTTNASLTVIGDRPLVIVARGDVTINSVVLVYGSGGVAGPGGAPPATGAGKGTSGTKLGGDASGGGGAGHGTAGGVGGDKAAVKGGAFGPLANALGALLGGSGGGHGGGYTAGVCGGRARGGAGGGALQISSVGKIVVNSAGGVDVGGGGGAGGCKNNGLDKYSGGGGGGAGGLVFFEAVGGIVINAGAVLEASGGAGGEGGDNNTNGADGQNGMYPYATAIGGFGAGNGGNGGNGGNLSVLALPQPGASGGDTGGGGGGAIGRVFLRTRGATLIVTGGIAAQRTDDMTF